MGNAGAKWSVPLLFLLTCISLSSAQFTSPCPGCGFSTTYVSAQKTADGAILNASIVASTADYSQERDISQMSSDYISAIRGNLSVNVTPTARTAQHYPIAGAEVFFFYNRFSVDSSGRLTPTQVPIAGCYPATADDSGSASCFVPNDVFENACVKIFVSYSGNQTIGGSSDSVTVCDSGSDAFAAMGAGLASAVDPANPLCMAAILISGLLLASMFFSGRSPLSLLDITTPLLPKPKSISYSGISYGVGYVRMAREYDNIKRLSDKHLSLRSDELKKELARRGMSGRELDAILALAKGNPGMGYLALRALREGRIKTFAEARKIAALKPVPGNDQDLKAAGALINSMQKGRQKDQDLEAISIGISAVLGKKNLGLITGNVPKPVVTIRDKLLDSKKSPFRYLLPERIRDQIKVGIGSAFFGGRSALAVAKQVYVAMPAKALGIKLQDEEKKARAREFYLMDIRGRIQALYNAQVAEAKANVAMYLVRRILESRGVKLSLSEKEIMQLGEIDILRRMNIKNNAKLSEIDRKICDILSKSTDIEKKILELKALARSEGVKFDEQGINLFISKLRSIDSMGSFREKLQELHEYLRDHHSRNPIGSDNFYAWVGRESLRVSLSGQTVRDDTWTFLYLRSYLEQNEAGKKAQAEDVAKLLWLRIVNETWGLLPSNTKGLPADKREMMSQAETYLRSLLTNEGKEALKGLKSVFELLYNPAGGKEEFGKLFYGGELARELGPNPSHWKMDVRGYWRVYVPGSQTLGDSKHAKTCVMEQAEGAVSRSHIARRQSREEIARDMLYNRIRAMVGAAYPDAYYTSNSEFRFLASAYGAYKERYAQLFGKTDAQRKDSSWVTDENISDFIKKGISLEDLQKFVWLRTREGSYIPYTEGREMALRVSDGERIINGRLSVNMGGRWIEYDPIKVSERMRKEDIRLPDSLQREQQAILNAIHLSRQAQEGLLRRKELSPELKDAMHRFAQDLSEWSRAGNRQDVAAHILLRIGKEANDLSALESTGLMAIRPKRDLEYVGFRKILEGVWQPFSKGFENSVASAFLPKIRDLYNMSAHSEYFRARTAEFSARYAASIADPRLEPNINPAVRKNMDELVAAMSRYRAVWDDTITRDPRGNSSSLGPQLNFASMYHHGPALHPNPNSVLEQFGGRTFRQTMESIRLMPLAINWTLGAPFILMVRGAMTSWYGYPSKHDKTYHPLQPYEMTPSRTLEGFRSLFDPFYSALDFTSGSFRKVASMLLSPLHPIGAVGSAMRIPDPAKAIADSFKASDSTQTGFVGRTAGLASDVMKGGTTFRTDPEYYLPYYVQKSAIREWLTGPMVQREYGGKSVQDGMIRTHEDHAWMYKNINVVWSVNTNPGVSYLDFQYQVQADPRLATHLISGTRFKSFFSQDEYLQKQANIGIVQRETSPYELAEARENELRFYGPRSNRMWGFLNPMTFFYNNPLPILSMATASYLTEKAPEKLRELAERAERREQLRYADMHAPPKMFMHGMPVGSVDSKIMYTSLQPAEAAQAETTTERFIRRAGQIAAAVFANTQFVSCPSCHSPMQRGSHICPLCSGKSLLFLRSKRQWAPFRGPPGGQT